MTSDDVQAEALTPYLHGVHESIFARTSGDWQT